MNPRINILLFLVLTFFSCNNPANTTLETRQKTSAVVAHESTINEVALDTITSDPDVNFDTFLRLFNRDSLFQTSRISFPLKIQEADASKDFDLREQIIQKGDLLKLDFSYDKKKVNKEYEQTIKIKRDKAVIEVRGIENGIFADYFFEKRNGKWTLVTWIDSST